MTNAIKAAALALGLCAASPAAFAQVSAPESNPDALPRIGGQPGDWRVSVGAAAIWRPEWDGSDDGGLLAVPDLDVRWKNRFFASFRTGVGWNLVNDNGWRAGPYAKLKFGRDEEDDAALKGLGDVDATAELGGFVDYSWAFVRGSLEVRQGVGGHEGLVVEAGGDLRYRFGPEVAIAAGPRLRWVDETYANAFFGVTPAQSAASGLPVFSAGSGLESLGIGAAILYRPGPKTVVTLFAEQSQLQGDAADSPLVRLRGTENQTRAGIAFGYRLGK